MTNSQKFITLPILGGLMLLGGGIAGYVGMVSADTSTSGNQERHMFDESTPHVGGEVTAVNGTTITVNDMRKGGTYTIDASGATFMKDGASADISSITVGGHVMAEGTLDGTTLTATKVMSGMPKGGHGFGGPGGRGHGVMGQVTAVDGNTITVTGKDGQSYTVNAGSATVQKMVAGSISDIAVGDRIGVQGTVSGNSVTATQIMDDLPEPPAQQ